MAFLTDEEKQTLLDRYFDIKWCDDVSDHRCVRCHRVAINHCVSSCQHIFCKTCINFYNDEERQPKCLQCQETITPQICQDFNVEVKLHRLEMFCPNKKYGCRYADELRNIPSHLTKCVFTQEAADRVESKGTITTEDVVNQLTNHNSAIGELAGGLREVTDKVHRMERKIDDTVSKINASTSKDSGVEGGKAHIKLESNNYAEEFQSMESKLETVHQRIEQIELHHQQTMELLTLNMEEMRIKMASITQEIETLQNKESEESVSLIAESYVWTIKNVKKNLRKENCKYYSEVFHLPGYKYDIKARFEREDGSSFIGLQFKYGNTINENFNNDGFQSVKYTVKDRSRALLKKDIIRRYYLPLDHCSCNLKWLFETELPEFIFAPPYGFLVDDCIKIVITLKPPSIDRSFVSNNGILEWRVDNYRKRMRDRLFSPTYSPSFYTSPRGYRVRVKLQIYDSLLLGVAPRFLVGEHDGRLPLHFPRNTTVTLINRTDPSMNLVVTNQFEYFEFYEMDLSTSISMEELGFIKDDSLLLKIVIEPLAHE